MAVLEEKKVFTFIWRIKDIGMHPFFEDIHSSVFMVDFLHKTEWKLIVWRDSSKNLHCYLQRTEGGDCEQDITIGFSITAISVQPEKDIKIIVERDTFGELAKGRAELILDRGTIKSLLHERLCVCTNEFGLMGVIIIHCEMWKCVRELEDTNFIVPDYPNNICSNVEDSSNANQCSALTRIKVRSICALWTIESFSTLRIHQSLFKSVTSAGGGTSFNMTLYLSEESETDQCVKIEISRKGYYKDNKSDIVYGKIKLLGSPKNIQYEQTSVHCFSSIDGNAWIFPTFLKTKDLIEGGYLYHTDDVLFLYCEFVHTDSSKYYNSELKYSESLVYRPIRRYNCSRDDFQRLYRNGKSSDFTIRVGTRTFAVHKSILETRSNVFSAMFDSDMREKASGVLDILDFNPNTVDQMLNYIYTDSLENMTYEEVSELYCAADKYNLQSLKCRCCSILMATLSLSHVCDVLKLANTYEDENLVQAGRCFLLANARETFHSEKWKALMKSDSYLALQIMHVFLTKDLLP